MNFYSFQFITGLEKFAAGKYDDAYEHLTKALLVNGNLIDAMEKRAFIHFKLNEFDECVIECEEILKVKNSPEIRNLKAEAEIKSLDDEPWYEVLNVSKNADSKTVTKAFNLLAKKFHLNGKINSGISIVDQKKMNLKMAKFNKARLQFRSL